MSQAITCKEDTLLRYLQESIAKSRRIRFNVAFLLESGVKALGPSYLIDLLGDGLDIRFYNDNLVLQASDSRDTQL